MIVSDQQAGDFREQQERDCRVDHPCESERNDQLDQRGNRLNQILPEELFDDFDVGFRQRDIAAEPLSGVARHGVQHRLRKPGAPGAAHARGEAAQHRAERNQRRSFG